MAGNGSGVLPEDMQRCSAAVHQGIDRYVQRTRELRELVVECMDQDGHTQEDLVLLNNIISTFDSTVEKLLDCRHDFDSCSSIEDFFLAQGRIEKITNSAGDAMAECRSILSNAAKKQ